MTGGMPNPVLRPSPAQRDAWEVACPWWGGRCAYCGGPAWLWEHVHPRSRGGPNTAANLVPGCGVCNRRKYDRPVGEFLAGRPEVLAKVIIYQFAMEHMPAPDRLRWLAQHGPAAVGLAMAILAGIEAWIASAANRRPFGDA